jgi:LysR family transcriptional regulator for metE and metH
VNPIHIIHVQHEVDSMYIELRHLRTIRAIHQSGGLARAAEMLNITQSALSHQVAGLEDQVGMELFTRRSRPMTLTAAGVRLLRAADRILPEISALEDEFRALHLGKTGRLHIAIQCHACFDWLFPVLEMFRQSWPEIDVDIRAGLAFDSFPALLREEVDLVISSNPEDLSGVTFNPLFDYHPMFLAASNHPLAAKSVITAEDFRDQTIIHYPVGRDKLDVFTELLTPAAVEPRATRPVELTAVILMLVASGRGVAVLPDWVLRDIKSSADYITRPLGPQTVTKRLYAATRTEDGAKPYIAHFLRLGRSEPVKLQRG